MLEHKVTTPSNKTYTMKNEYEIFFKKCLVHFQPKVYATHKILHMTTFVKPMNVKITMKMQILELNHVLIMRFYCK
jgi:hypothetical protein